MPYSVEGDLCSDEGLRHTLEYLLPVVAGNTTITYGEIAVRLRHDLHIANKVFPTHIGHVVGTLTTRILKIDQNAPLINVLVINQTTGQPSEGADGFLRERYELHGPIGEARRRALVSKEAGRAYVFSGWPRIYRRLFDQAPPPIEPAALVEGTEADGKPPPATGGGKRHGGPAESQEHRALKDYVFRHPSSVGSAKKPNHAETEFLLLSGDEVDVFFAQPDEAQLVEVKSIRSNDIDLRRGVYQCIKYRAVFRAQRKETTPDIKIRAILVIEEEPPAYIRNLARQHGVKLVIINVNG